jgi:hypothetical protein
MPRKDVARAEAEQDQLEAIQRLTDLANEQARAGLSHSGVVLADLALTTASREVAHNLGRVPTIILALKLGAPGVVYSDTPHADPRNYVYLKASATLTASVLVA